jgi:flagellar biosynthesis protein
MNDKRMKRAAALKYDQASNMAPRVVARGKGHIAEQIIRVARENNVPLHEDPNLVNVLEAMELEAEIPDELYRAVAEVLVFIYRLNGRL